MSTTNCLIIYRRSDYEQGLWLKEPKKERKEKTGPLPLLLDVHVAMLIAGVEEAGLRGAPNPPPLGRPYRGHGPSFLPWSGCSR